MKKIFTLLSIALTCQLASAQNQNTPFQKLKERFENRRTNTTEQVTEVPEIEINLDAAAGPCRLDTAYESYSGSEYRTIYSYNLGRVSERVFEYWDGTTWVASGRTSYTYGTQGNMTMSVYEYWNGSEWVNSWKYTYTYDGQGNQTEELYQNWNGSDWENSEKYMYSYDGQGNQTEEIYQEWNGSDWENSYKDETIYNGQGLTTQYTSYNWDGSNWVPSYQTLITYDGQGNATEYLEQNWDGSMWVNEYKSTASYDAFGNFSQINYYIWNSSTNMWDDDGAYSISYMYDGQNRVTESIEQEDGVNSWKATYTYDSYGNTLTENYYEWSGSAWVDNGSYTYVYDCASSVEEEEANAFGLNLWPNPVANTLNLKVAKNQPNTIAVFDASGKMVMTQAYTTQIAVDALTPGMYVLELRNEEAVQHQRFIKQ